MDKLQISPHTMIIQHSPQLVLLYQSLLRKGVMVDLSIYKFLYNISKNLEYNKIIKCADVSSFSLSNCLLDNSAGIEFDLDLELQEYTSNDFIELLKKHSILVVDNSYISRFDKSDNILDNQHIGSFHQQLSSHLLKNHKGDPEEWWLYQKFNRELSAPKNNPYSWIQYKFISNFFKDKLQEQKLLDFGCGIGFYSDFFSQYGADVTGVDPSQLYIEIAETRFNKDNSKKFMVAAFEKIEDFNILKNDKYDIIFMSDVLYYYFNPYKKLEITPTELLCELRKLLTVNGSIYIMDPHGFFYLQPWLDMPTPMILSAEYKHNKFRITPTLEELFRSIEEAGLYVKRLRELYCDENEFGGTLNKKILKEFPLWWFLELKK